MEPHNEAMFLRSYIYSMKDAHPMPIRSRSKNSPVKGHWICAVFWSLGILLLSDPSDLRASAPPNILLIMADDLGFRTWGAMAARFRLHNSTAWPPKGFVLPNFTTPLDAGQLVVLS